ncbi:amidinotransferase [Xinfangfangia sp. D13-10-4-6]|uniref:dimethylarginine dimethylaminohydrolase family protein n=1 Tax=Pseudogemmobacter hezensis TaxID=2737662 RepID=UPI00155645FE|nr:arginine deiminase family protein [Pseudogemmobacter hezensis]NPD17447.1 amidinotransferase [Pseudogemmobacter hezensis]
MSIITEGEYRYNQLIKQFPSQAEPAFESAEQQELVWGQVWGCDNDVGQIRKVLMHRPGDELNVVDPTKRIPGINAFGEVDKGWYWRGDVIPTLAGMQAQHDAYAAALREEGAEVVYVDKAAPGKMKQVYTRDSVIAVKGGAIITRLGPPIRRGEELPVTRTLAAMGMPILRTISGIGLMEGGSFAWIRPNLAVVGLSSRVDREGARQLAEVLATQGVELLMVELTGYRLHIDGTFVMVDENTAFVNPTIVPFWFLEKLKSLGIHVIEVHHEDNNWVVNCLAVRPGRVLMSTGLSDHTAEQFDKAGISVRFVDYDKVALGGGGLHCSTAPLVRDSL